jgi:hypothetical protein
VRLVCQSLWEDWVFSRSGGWAVSLYEMTGFSVALGGLGRQSLWEDWAFITNGSPFSFYGGTGFLVAVGALGYMNGLVYMGGLGY